MNGITAPLTDANIVCAVYCEISLSGFKAYCIVDSGSGISLVSKELVSRNKIPTVQWTGPTAVVVNGSVLEVRHVQSE